MTIRYLAIFGITLGCGAQLVACREDEPVTNTDDSDDDVPCSSLIDEPYCYLWDLDTPCEDGGPRIHRLTGPGTVSLDPQAPISHVVVGIYGRSDVEDFRDELALRATVAEYSPEQVGCPNCDLVIRLDYDEVNVQSGWSYSGKSEVLAIDYLGMDGAPYEDSGFIGYSFRVNANGTIQDYGAPDIVGSFEPTSGDSSALPAVASWTFRGASGACSGRW